jgi:hypothetical protein
LMGRDFGQKPPPFWVSQPLYWTKTVSPCFKKVNAAQAGLGRSTVLQKGSALNAYGDMPTFGTCPPAQKRRRSRRHRRQVQVERYLPGNSQSGSHP